MVLRCRSSDLLEKGLAPYPSRPGVGVTDSVAGDVLENLASSVVIAEGLWREAEALRAHMTQECVDRGSPWTGRATHRIADPDDSIQLSAGKCYFGIAHPPIIPHETKPEKGRSQDRALGQEYCRYHSFVRVLVTITDHSHTKSRRIGSRNTTVATTPKRLTISPVLNFNASALYV